MQLQMLDLLEAMDYICDPENKMCIIQLCPLLIHTTITKGQGKGVED